jgi:opacity protein-like surface antigen
MINTSKKIIVAASALLALSQTANASSSEHSNGFYVVPKAVVIMGDTIQHGGHELKGDAAVGIGMDLGYSFTENYAVELAVTHAEADIKEDGVATGDAEYTTYGVNAVYSRTLTGHLRGLVKLGYVWEYEKMDEAHIKETLSGIAYAAGLEYGINDNMEVVFEYEAAEVVSSRGDTLMLGLKYKF